MISHDELLQAKREDILRIAAQYGASNVRVFGSVARGEVDERSDIDLLVDMEPGRTTALTLRQAIWHKDDPRWSACGITSVFYTDHGSNFTSKHLEQVAGDIGMELVFSKIGVPRGRGKVERFFRSVNQLFLQDVPGYSPKGYPEAEAVFTLPAFEQRRTEDRLSYEQHHDHDDFQHGR